MPSPVRITAPAAYRPGQTNNLSAQLKPANQFQLETRPAPPVYRPQQANSSSQPKTPSSSAQPQSRYQLSSPVWVGNGRQQIRVTANGSPTPIGSVDVYYKQGGKAFISDLEVAQAHRRHGIGTMLMKAAMDTARRNGSSATELEARPGPGSISNQALSGMYQKLGFRDAGASSRGNPRMLAAGSVQQKPFSGPMGPATRMSNQFFAGTIQRAKMVDDGEMEDIESSDEETPQVEGKSAARTLIKFIYGKKQTTDNWTVGVLTNGDLVIGKVNGLTSATTFVTDDLKPFIKRKKIEKGRDIYLAKVFHNGSSRHAEMCVLAAADALATNVTFMLCVAPNCDFCAQMLSDAGVPSDHHQDSNPTSQQGWTHPRKKVAYGTQLVASLSDQLDELKKLNKGTIGEDDITKGAKQGVKPQGQYEKWL